MECALEDDGVGVLFLVDAAVVVVAVVIGAGAVAGAVLAVDVVAVAVLVVGAAVVCCVDRAMMAGDFGGGDLGEVASVDGDDMDPDSLPDVISVVLVVLVGSDRLLTDSVLFGRWM